MLFLVFLRLFFYIVFLDAHPISKSNSYVCEADEQLENGEAHTKDVINILLNEDKNTYLRGDVLQNPFDNNKSGIFNKKHVNFKRDLNSKEIDFIGFKKSENLCKMNKFHSLIKTYKCNNDKSNIVKEKGFKNKYDVNEKTSLNPATVSTMDDKPILHNDLYMDSTRYETELATTAVMEIILNEIKQREIQTIADHLPSFSNLIKNAVTEITFSTMPLVSESNVSPNLISVDDIGKNRFSPTFEGIQVHNSKLRNILRRSIKQDTSTLANDVENFLQNKIKKVYNQIKNKFSKDIRNDMNKKTSTVKKQLDKITSKKMNTTQHTRNTKFKNSFATNAKIVKIHNNSTPSEVRKSRKTLFDQRNQQIESIDSTTHIIPSIGDDVSMLAILENILEKSQQDNELILNTLSYVTKNNKQEKPKRDSPHGTSKRDIQQELNNNEDGLYTEYTHWKNNKNNSIKLFATPKNGKRNNEISTEDTSYQGLSNKISYNDYVNGYKYYLNFQRDNDDQKYSSQIRYQAHKHHNVDDIGKFILDKIPHLPATRMRRELVDYETLEDQDVSTKSEESWFKKHFFMFIDSNPPKKFHTSQIVPLKPSEVHNMKYNNSVLSTKQTFEKNESSLPIQQRKSKFVKRFEYNYLKGK
nr:origin recognition complex subunit 1-like [Danaus plexippus plexippus]